MEIPTVKLVVGGLYLLKLKSFYSCDRKLCELALTSEGVLSSVTLIANDPQTPMMFLGKQIVCHSSNPYGKIPNTTSVVARFLVGEHITFLAYQREISRRNVFYEFPATEKWSILNENTDSESDTR